MRRSLTEGCAFDDTDWGDLASSRTELIVNAPNTVLRVENRDQIGPQKGCSKLGGGTSEGCVTRYLYIDAEYEQSELALMSPEGKCYYKERGLFHTGDNGLLYRQDPEGRGDRILVPKALRKELMRTNHDVPASRHQGVDRTKARLREKYYWWRLSGDIKEYVLTCRACSKNKTGKIRGKAQMKMFHAGIPWRGSI